MKELRYQYVQVMSCSLFVHCNRPETKSRLYGHTKVHTRKKAQETIILACEPQKSPQRLFPVNLVKNPIILLGSGVDDPSGGLDNPTVTSTLSQALLLALALQRVSSLALILRRAPLLGPLGLCDGHHLWC